MAQVIDYDGVADRFGRRYELYGYAGVGAAVVAFVGPRPCAVVEVGCGAGHWLAAIGRRAARLAGLDPSRRMLAHARTAAPGALLVRGRATHLPFGDASFDRIVCVNALHHFGDRPAFFGEARRVLRSGGGLLSVGLDPHAGRDRWWVYDYFERTRDLDAQRLAAAAIVEGELERAGFSSIATREVDRIEKRVSLAEALASGVVDRGFTSQLMMLSDGEYERGIARMRDADRVAGGAGQWLITDLHLYATEAWR